MNEVLIVLGWILLGILACITLGALIGLIIAIVKMSIVISYNMLDVDEEIVDLHFLRFKLKKQIENYEKKILIYASKVKEVNSNEKS